MQAKYGRIHQSKGMFVLQSLQCSASTLEFTMDIVVRSIIEKFWQACLDAVDTPYTVYRVVAVGTSGIGKTTSIPILIRMLLKKNRTVVYKFSTPRKEEWYYEFVPRSDAAEGNETQIDIHVYPEKLESQDIPSLQSRQTYFIVDAGEAKRNCVPHPRVLCKFFLVSSPGPVHWGGSQFTKEQNQQVSGLLKFLPTWYWEVKQRNIFFGPTS